MAKKDVSQDITKVSPQFELPAYMGGEKVTGLEALKQFIVPPFIKIIQKQSGDELLKLFGSGDVILSPMNAYITEMPRDEKGRPLDGAKASFKFVPIFFYPEWISWNPIELKGSEPSIRYRTVDSNDPVVTKCRNASLRSENHPSDPTGKLQIRHCEHLNFLVMLWDHTLGREPAILSFSRGEWKAGSRFAGLIQMRKAPLYGCVFEATVSMRHGQLGDWFGFDIANPEEGSPWVDETFYPTVKSLHEEFAEYHRDARIQASYDATPDVDEAASKGSDEF